MKDPQTLIWIILGFFWFLIGCAGSSLASKRNRNQPLWFANCILSGLFGLLVVACSTTLDYDEETDSTEPDILGWIVLVVSIIIFGLCIKYGYMEYKSYHDQMYWNSYFMLMK